ncbi:RsmB/NOP family class I SAM-dependent RNA methyltransferase [Shewanella gaetbuli]
MTDSQIVITQVANSSAEKRAISYANTILNLLDNVFSNKQPADRIIGQYFREHKKHGSKDRRVIRESLFGLFRWWGWLNQLGDYKQQQTFFQMLSITASLEQHPWQDIQQAWTLFGAKNATIDTDTAEASMPQTLLQKLDTFKKLSGLPQVIEADLVPQWFWQHCPIEDTTEKLALIESLCARPPIWARVQQANATQILAQLQAQNIAATGCEYFSDAINLGNKSINLNQVKEYTNGQLEIQDLASQVIGQICAPKDNSQWWDACSGAGGKSLQLMSLMQHAKINGHITASDIRKNALVELQKRAKRAGFNNITLAPWQSDAIPVKANAFDGVLVDAPCSCTGTWRRNPDMRWIDDASSITNKPALQLDILSRSSAAVKTGGELIYATCSLSPVENQQVVEAFLAQHPQFELQTITHPFTGEQATSLTIWPQTANSDGMFVAKMRKISC